jgi:hypothetical protein
MNSYQAEEHVKLLWEANLRSRDCFLMILEMLNLPRAHYRAILYLLVPRGGDAFFEAFMQKGKQFKRLPFFESTELLLDNAENRTPFFYQPSNEYLRDVLKHKGITFCKSQLGLKQIAYLKERTLECLSFACNDSDANLIYSPPPNTYSR